MEPVQEIGINFDNSFFNRYKHWKRFFRVYSDLQSNFYAYEDQNLPGDRNQNVRMFVVKRTTRFS